MDHQFLSLEAFERKVTIENATITFIGHNIIKDTLETSAPKLYHTHACAELFYCKKGEMTLKYADTELKLFEGDIVLIPPRISHFMKSVDNNINYDVGILLEKRKNTENFNVYKRIQTLFDGTEPLYFRRFYPIFPEEMAWVEQLFDAQTVSNMLSGVQVLLKLAENLKLNPMIENEEEYLGKKQSVMMQMENIIGGKYYEQITADELAQMLYISPRQLARIVRERYGTSLHQVILKKRIDGAAWLLTESNLSVEAICRHVGFGTKACFYRAFKKEHGMTPLQYRQRQLKSQ